MKTTKIYGKVQGRCNILLAIHMALKKSDHNLRKRKKSGNILTVRIKKVSSLNLTNFLYKLMLCPIKIRQL